MTTTEMIGNTHRRGCRFSQRCSVFISTLFCDAGGQGSRQEGREDQEEGSAQLLSSLALKAPQIGLWRFAVFGIFGRPTVDFEKRSFTVRTSCPDCRANSTLR